MTKRMATMAAALLLVGAAAPAWADGAGPDDCAGKNAGDACYSYDLQMSGVCVADSMGLLACDVSGTGGTGGKGGGTTTSSATGGGGSGGEGGGGASSGASGGCSVRKVRANGGPEAMGLGMLLALCFAVQRRRRVPR
jgi:uncharacterized membrane protein YgcG